MTLAKKLALSASLIALTTASLTVPVSAHRDHPEDSTYKSNAQVMVTDKINKVSSDVSKVDDKVKTEIQNRAKQSVDDLKKTAQQKTQAARQTACTTRKSGTEQRVQSIAKNTTNLQTKLDGIFAKVKTYQTDKGLTVANYDSLVAAVDAAKAASATSVATLESLKPSIDCAKDTNAQNVAAYRTAAQDARDKLKTYMQSLKDLLKAVKDAKTSNSGTGSDN